MRSDALTAAVLVTALATSTAAEAGSYTFLTIDPPGSVYTQLTGINRRHEVSGWWKDSSLSNAVAHAFVWRDGTFTQLPARSDGLALYAINEAGVAVGRENPDRAGGDAILYRTARDRLTLPVSHATGLTNSSLFDINNGGVAVGSASSKGKFQPPDTAIVVDGAAVLRVAGLHGVYNRVVGINDAGQGFGASYDAASEQSWFSYAAGQATMLTFPPGTDQPTVASISEDGRLVGSYHLKREDRMVGFVYRAGRYQRTEFPAAQGTNAFAANGKGVFGTYLDAQFRPPRVFVRANLVYHAISPPDFPALALGGVAADGSYVASYRDTRHALHGFVAICAPDQQPCTQ